MQGVVPRRDGRDDADRLSHESRVALFFFPDVVHGSLCVIGEGHGRQADLNALGQHERHADLVGDDERNLVAALSELLRDAHKVLAALLRTCVGPASKAAAAASTARLASSTVPAGTVAKSSPVPEVVTSRVSPDVAGTHSPLM